MLALLVGPGMSVISRIAKSAEQTMEHVSLRANANAFMDGVEKHVMFQDVITDLAATQRTVFVWSQIGVFVLKVGLAPIVQRQSAQIHVILCVPSSNLCFYL